MKYDVQATMVLTAVVKANSEAAAREIAERLLLIQNEANTALSGDAYGVPEVTEFSIGWNREDAIDADEAVDIDGPDLIERGIGKMLALDETRQREGRDPSTQHEREASDTIAMLCLWGQGYAGPEAREGNAGKTNSRTWGAAVPR
jgi:hypothetical protein